MSVIRTLGALLLILYSIAPAPAAGARTLLLSEKSGVLVSADNGRSWERLSGGLPEAVVPLGMHLDPYGNMYLVSRESGLFMLADGASRWKALNDGVLRLRSELHPERFRKITAFAADGTRPGTLALATKHALYRSHDGGRSWAGVPMKSLEHNHYITALAFGAGGALYAGTSFHGIYRVTEHGLAASSAGLPAEPYSKDMVFYEETGAIAADPSNSTLVYAAMNFGGGLFASRDGGRSWKAMPTPDGKTFRLVDNLTATGDSIYLCADGEAWRFNMRTGAWSLLGITDIMRRLPRAEKLVAVLVDERNGTYPPLLYRLAHTETRRENDLRDRAAGKRALYASVPAVRRNLAGLVAEIKECGMNAMVIDMKDDFGNLHFPTDNEIARGAGAVRKSLDVRTLTASLRREGIHSIARVVVFKDPNLFRYDGNRHAIWNARTNAPWRGAPGEYWVDPHSRLVQDYTISISRELAALGFDEIQFDYIRFPSDGPTHLCRYRHRRFEDGFKSELIGDFLERAKRAIPVPLSVDIYGFNAMYRFGNWIGQDAEVIASIVDAVCPMVYPSHFGTRYYRRFRGDEHPYRIVLDSGIRARVITGEGAPIRPYLQAFKMLSPTWGPGYIRAQTDAVHDSGVSGFSFWNAKGEYDMVRRVLGGRHPGR